MTKYILYFTIFINLITHAQTRMVMDANVFLTITDTGNVVIDNSNDNGIMANTASNIISEGENNVVKWVIGNNTGNYIVPFTTSSLVKIPLQLSVSSAGVSSNGSVIFSTYETATDKNTIYPSDVANLNSNCKDSVGLQVVDRFWRIDAKNYTTKPTPIINFGFDSSPNEVAITNTINIGALKAMRFNNTINSWETPQKIFGITSSNSVNNATISPTDFYKSWTLIDTTIMNVLITLTSAPSLTVCNGALAVISVTGATTYTLLPNNMVSANNFTVVPTANAIYTITGSVGTGTALCVTSTNSALIVTVSLIANPSVNTIVQDVKCNGDNNGQIIVSASSASSITYSWNTGSNAPIISGLTAGIYSVTVLDANNCAITQTAIVNEPPAIAITEVENKISCDNSATGLLSIDITGGVPTYSVLWNNNVTAIIVDKIPSGVYTATVTDANSCKQTYNTVVKQEKCLVTLIPQLISPNGDGKNDFFFINTIDYFPNNKLEIYNRWGSLIYSKNKYDNSFNGTANVRNSLGNGLLPASSYFVVFDFGDWQTPSYKGYLEIKY